MKYTWLHPLRGASRGIVNTLIPLALMVPPDRDAVRAEVERIALSVLFRNSERRVQVLQYTVEKALAGEKLLKEYTLGVDVFRRPESYDPRIEPLVRVEFGRIRQKLREYYATEGLNDPIRIEYNRRGYLPTFSAQDAASHTTASSKIHPARRPGVWAWLMALNRAVVLIALSAIVLAAAGSGWAYFAHLRTTRLFGADYQLYLRAQFLLDDRTPQRVRQALESFEQLTQSKPRSALAWAGLAKAYAVTAANDFEDPGVYGPKARSAVDRALRLAPRLAEAHSASGLLKTFYEWDWKGADDEFRRALAANPALSEAHLGSAMNLLVEKRFNEAVTEAGRAVELEPGSVANRRGLAICYFYAGRFDDALEECRRLLRSGPQPWAHGLMYQIYRSTHQFDDSKVEAAGMVALPENVPPDLGFVYDSRLWRQTEASAELQRLIDESRQRYVQPLVIATAAGAAEDERQHREWLEIAYRRHDPAVIWLSLLPTSEPAIREIVKRMGLVPAGAEAVSSARPHQ
jgi:tetratricopeptide (TPR) repeat protein